MDNNKIIIYEAPKAELKPYRNNYNLTIANETYVLVRDIDFGKVPKAKKPSIWKSGAEKILTAYNLSYDTEIVDSYKNHEKGYFYYEILAKAYFNGSVVRTGVGCANTSESGNGMANGFNQANSALKKAKKRAVVDLALTLACLSDCFTQDIEDDDNDKRAEQILKDNDCITPKQTKRIFAIAGANEITVEQAKQMLSILGFVSTKEITQNEYDLVCDYFEKTQERDKIKTELEKQRKGDKK